MYFLICLPLICTSCPTPQQPKKSDTCVNTLKCRCSLLAEYTDIWRHLHPEEDNAFSVWDERTNKRPFNEVGCLWGWSLTQVWPCGHILAGSAAGRMNIWDAHQSGRIPNNCKGCLDALQDGGLEHTCPPGMSESAAAAPVTSQAQAVLGSGTRVVGPCAGLLRCQLAVLQHAIGALTIS